MSAHEDRLSILLIDSHDTDRNYYADRLKLCSAEYLVHQAASGKVGLALYKAEPIYCVVLEIDLADMSGFEVLPELMSSRPQVAVVVLTHLANPFILELALKNGAMAALYKKTTPGEVLDKTILRTVSTVPRDRKKVPLPSRIQLELPEPSL